MLPSLAMQRKYPAPICQQCRKRPTNARTYNTLTDIPIYYNLCSDCHVASLTDFAEVYEEDKKRFREWGHIKEEADMPRCSCGLIKHVWGTTSRYPPIIQYYNTCYKCHYLHDDKTTDTPSFDIPKQSRTSDPRSFQQQPCEGLGGGDAISNRFLMNSSVIMRGSPSSHQQGVLTGSHQSHESTTSVQNIGYFLIRSVDSRAYPIYRSAGITYIADFQNNPKTIVNLPFHLSHANNIIMWLDNNMNHVEFSIRLKTEHKPAYLYINDTKYDNNGILNLTWNNIIS